MSHLLVLFLYLCTCFGPWWLEADTGKAHLAVAGVMSSAEGLGGKRFWGGWREGGTPVVVTGGWVADGG